ncbi:MAG: N-acetylmuramoyl-L-alanine amidase, partial [Ferruginibacter sp.]
FSLLGNTLFAQDNYSQLFNNAYNTYPKIPKNSLEVLAYVQSRISNLVPPKEMDHHHGPNRYGLFALIENGENYFKNTLEVLSASSKISTTKLKNDAQSQILAVAKNMNEYCEANNVTTIEGMAIFFKAFSEIPDKTIVDAFAKDQFLYDVYLTLQKGVVENGVEITQTIFKASEWFSESTYKLVSAQNITIANDKITNGKDVYDNQNRLNANTTAAAVVVTDYPPALWVASPNYSTRGTSAITAVAVHTMQGSYSGSISWFQNAASNVSAHYCIRSSDGQVTQMVRESSKAWHIGSENPYTIGLEHEGYVANASWYTTAMYNSSAALVIDICNDNNINKTTCFSGAATVGVNVLSTAIKIKGHQHFTGQTHVDPGVNWNWALYYNLINPVAPCATPSNLTSSGVTTSSANLNWSAVAGVASYSLEYKLSTSTTYTVVNGITTNSFVLSGLIGTNTYNWRVRSNCTSSSSAFSTAVSFTTLTPCGITTVLNESYVGTVSVNLNWAAVSGATGYILEGKAATSTSWTTYNSTNNYYTITGLLPSTIYNWRIKTVCSSGTGLASTTQTFTTNSLCYDAYENNNVYTAPTIYPSLNGGYVYAKICSAGDVDFYKVTTTATSNINFTLANLPQNYNIETFTATGAFLKGSYNVGTTDEAVVLNNKPAGSYLFKVYGVTNTTADSYNDYRLLVTTSAPTIARIADEPFPSNTELNITPNPANTETVVSFYSDNNEKVMILIKDMYGNIKQKETKTLFGGIQKVVLNVQTLKQGVYLVQIINNAGITKSGQLIISK